MTVKLDEAVSLTSKFHLYGTERYNSTMVKTSISRLLNALVVATYLVVSNLFSEFSFFHCDGLTNLGVIWTINLCYRTVWERTVRQSHLSIAFWFRIFLLYRALPYLKMPNPIPMTIVDFKNRHSAQKGDSRLYSSKIWIFLRLSCDFFH